MEKLREQAFSTAVQFVKAAQQYAVRVTAAGCIVWLTAAIHTEHKKIEACLATAHRLDTQYRKDVFPGLLKLEDIRRKLGQRYPEALFIKPVLASPQEAATAWQVMREAELYWRAVKIAYDTNDVLHPGQMHPIRAHVSRACSCLGIPPSFLGVEDIDPGFFSRHWAGRGQHLRELVEPVDIANWYFRHKNVKHGHYTDGIVDAAKDDNDKRPGRYLFLQQQEVRVFGGDKGHQTEDSLPAGYRLKKLLGENPWDSPERQADDRTCTCKECKCACR